MIGTPTHLSRTGALCQGSLPSAPALIFSARPASEGRPVEQPAENWILPWESSDKQRLLGRIGQSWHTITNIDTEESTATPTVTPMGRLTPP